MSLELTGVHGLLKRHKLFTHKNYNYIFSLFCIKKVHGKKLQIPVF